MKDQWTKEQAWRWYNTKPWIRGCNFIGSDCANRRDLWQSYGRRERMAVADKEMALAESIGFNSIRMLVDFDVWYQEPDSFMSVFEEYLSIAASHKLSVMPVLANEAELPRGDEPYSPKRLGEQVYAIGIHQGRFPLSDEERAKLPWHFLEREHWREKFLEMVRMIVSRYKDDDRILCWNVYNEPGNKIRERAIPLLDMLFDTVRSCDPKQPLTADVWNKFKDGRAMRCEEQHALELSDVISFHYYGSYVQTVVQINEMKKIGRPLFCTEWLNRINHNDVKEIYPLFYLEGIACYCWGFVVGKTQTNEPWEALWKQYYDPEKNVDYDFTKWQHDLFRISHRPYDPHEIELIGQFNSLADERARDEGLI
ncbi:MAG: hypothetical protein E7646_05775 [Ruminococcaceae bacterium]|nr:hypothetical protein [Oscillospiraceae bacterium]